MAILSDRTGILGGAPAVYLSVSVSPQAAGSTSPSGSNKESIGATVPVTATTNPGYNFDHWELDGVNVGTANPYTVTMNTSHTLVAIFVISGLVSGVSSKPNEIFPNPQISESVYSLSNTPLVSNSISESVYSLSNTPLVSESISESVIVTNS